MEKVAPTRKESIYKIVAPPSRTAYKIVALRIKGYIERGLTQIINIPT